MGYIKNILLWVDIGLNVLICGGSPYESLSSRIGKRASRGDRWACVLCRLLDKIDKRHCETTQVPDYGKTLSNWWK